MIFQVANSIVEVPIFLGRYVPVASHSKLEQTLAAKMTLYGQQIKSRPTLAQKCLVTEVTLFYRGSKTHDDVNRNRLGLARG